MGFGISNRLMGYAQVLLMLYLTGKLVLICHVFSKVKEWVSMEENSSGKYNFAKGEYVNFFTRSGEGMESSDGIVASVDGDTVEVYLRFNSSRGTFKWDESYGEYIHTIPEGRTLPDGKKLTQGVIRPVRRVEQRNRVNIPE